MTLKDKAVSGLLWNFSGSFANQFISLFIGIILARLLGPREYGLVGMVTIFTVLAQPFINSGFSQSLIRKKNCSQADYSTVFIFNLLIGVLFYLLLFLSAPVISDFFNEPQLVLLVRVVGIIIIIEALNLIQRTILTKQIDFKLQTKISIISSFISGIVGISLAFYGFGVWSLVFRTLAQQIISSSLLWLSSKWKPSLIFRYATLKEHFSFGSKLLINGIIDKVYYNIYNIVIAKFFLARELGLFSRGEMFKNFIAQNISEIVAGVAFPVLSNMKDEPVKLKSAYKRFFLNTMFLTSTILFSLVVVAEPFVITVIGEQWEDSIIYMQLLCIVGVFYPIHPLTRNVFYVYGKSSLVLGLGIMSKSLAVPSILVGIFFGIKYMLMGMIISSITEFFIKAFFLGKLIKYSLKEQINDLMPSFILAIVVSFTMLIFRTVAINNQLMLLIIQVTTGTIIFIVISELFKLREYIELKFIFYSKIKTLKFHYR